MWKTIILIADLILALIFVGIFGGLVLIFIPFL